MSDIAPTASSMCLHRVHRLSASDYPDNAGCFRLTAHNSGYETFDLAVFTDNGNMAIELAEAINAVLAKHNRLNGQTDAVAQAESA